MTAAWAGCAPLEQQTAALKMRQVLLGDARAERPLPPITPQFALNAAGVGGGAGQAEAQEKRRKISFR